MSSTNDISPTSVELDLSQASEIRDATGRRRFGSAATLRRKVKNGTLAHTQRDGKYFVLYEDLEGPSRAPASSAEVAFAELQAAAKRAADAAPALTAERVQLITSILRGASA